MRQEEFLASYNPCTQLTQQLLTMFLQRAAALINAKLYCRSGGRRAVYDESLEIKQATHLMAHQGIAAASPQPPRARGQQPRACAQASCFWKERPRAYVGIKIRHISRCCFVFHCENSQQRPFRGCAYRRHFQVRADFRPPARALAG